jgi:hypothetical protein
MWIESGAVDRNIYIIAVDSADLRTRLTGLNAFTVYYSRDGSVPAAYAAPTVTEMDAVNMPGVYSVLIDTNTTLAAGHASEEYVIHVTHATMNPITRAVDIYSPILPMGAVEFTYTVTSTAGANPPIDGVEVWFSTDNPTGSANDVANVAWSGVTDAFGVARDLLEELPFLNPGTYYVWRQKAGILFTNPDIEVVSL